MRHADDIVVGFEHEAADASSWKAKRSASARTISTIPTAPAGTCIRHSGVHARRLDLVNPYVTLISAYGRLIGGHGRETGSQIAASPVAHELPDDIVKPSVQEGSEN